MSVLSRLQEAWENPPQGPSWIGGAKAAWEAFKAPGRAINEGMTPDEMIKSGMDFAMTVGAGGSLVPKPGNSLGMFGGRMAKTANLKALSQAERLEKAGTNREDIWKLTGWGKGTDGEWRFEIPDHHAQFRNGIPKEKTNMGEAFSHPELYKAYPELAEGTVRQTSPGVSHYGANYGLNRVGINPTGPHPRSTMLHELQHSVQDIEDFARGTNTVHGPQSVYDKLVKSTHPDAPRLARIAKEKLKKSEQFAWKVYRNHAGEVESRNVQARQDLSPLERRMTPMWKTEDIPTSSQFVAGRGEKIKWSADAADPIAQANKTARSAGAVGAKAITPRYVQGSVKQGETVLNFGAGKPDKKTGKYLHSEMLREKGADVTEYDFGSNSVGNLGNQYDTVFASNVLNVQNGRPMLQDTLKQIKNSTRGRAVFNYPQSPRYMDLTPDEVATEIKSIFGAEPKRVGGTKQAPLWEIRTGND